MPCKIQKAASSYKKNGLMSIGDYSQSVIRPFSFYFIST